MNSFLEGATSLKMNSFLGNFLGFCYKVSEDFFYLRTLMIFQNTSFYISSNKKYVVHGLFKII